MVKSRVIGHNNVLKEKYTKELLFVPHTFELSRDW